MVVILGWFSKDQMLPEFSKATLCPKRGRDYSHSYKDNILGGIVIYLIDKKRAGEIEFDRG